MFQESAVPAVNRGLERKRFLAPRPAREWREVGYSAQSQHPIRAKR
jgi:hypothetical protein